MDFNFSNPQMINQEEKLAAGDASCTDYFLLSPSLTDLLPHPLIEEPKENKNADIWKYQVASAENVPTEGVPSPKFFPIGSLRKTEYQDSSKREAKIKCPKRESKLFDRINKNVKGSHSNECFTRQQSQPALSFVNMERLFACQACHTSPMTSMTVHMCRYGHQVCGNCYHHSSTCAICGEPLEGRNHPVETALKKLHSLRPELFFQEFLAPSSDQIGVNQLKAVHQSSHKPVQCPHLSCCSSVAYNGFLLHFKFEHSAVPILSTYPDCSHQFPLHEMLLNDTYTRALRVFKVTLLKIRPKKYEGDPIVCCLLSVPFHIGYVKSLAVWCSSTFDDGTTSPLSYSLKSPNPRRSIAYRGPIVSLHENTEDILREGRCLMVPPDMLENIPLQNESPYSLQIEFYANN